MEQAPRIITSEMVEIPPLHRRAGRIAPCEHKLKEQLELLEQARLVDPGGVAKLARTIASNSYWFYLRYILGYEWMDPWFHGEVLVKFLDENPKDSKLILMPRGSGKTSVVTAPRVAWWIAKNPSDGIILINAREERAKAMGRAAISVLLNNKRYKQVFPYVRPGAKWGEAGYFLDPAALETYYEQKVGGIARVDPVVSTYGLGGNITGSHVAGGMIVDDLINEAIASSPGELAKAEAFFKESQNCIDPGEEQLAIGTRWAFTDFYGGIISGDIEGNNGPFKCLVLGVYDRKGNLIFPERKFFFQGREKTTGYSVEFIESRKKNLKHLFSALYLNTPVSDTDVQFDLHRVMTFKNLKELPFELGPVRALGIELESQGVGLLSVLREELRAQKKTIKLTKLNSAKMASSSVKRRLSKDDRIKAMLQPPMANSEMFVLESLWKDDQGLGEELRRYPKWHDDLLDAFAYAAWMARDAKEGERPEVAIACDPSFSSTYQSDRTGIVACCRYNGALYCLGAKYFKTDRVDHICRMLIRFYDKFNQGQRTDISRFSTPVCGITGSGYKQAREARDNDSFFDIDTSYLIKQQP